MPEVAMDEIELNEIEAIRNKSTSITKHSGIMNRANYYMGRIIRKNNLNINAMRDRDEWKKDVSVTCCVR